MKSGTAFRRRLFALTPGWGRPPRVVAAGLAVTVITAGALMAPAAAGAAEPAPSTGIFPNGQTVLDTDGKSVQAHGGGFLEQKVDPETNRPDPDGVTTYFWVGEDKSSNSAVGNPVHLYKSTDLTHWEDLGIILDVSSQDEGGNRPLNHNKLERPKLLYNEATGQYVLWAHYETAASYTASELVVATSDTVTGPYTIEGGQDGTSVHFRPGAGDNRPEAFGNRYGSAVRDWDASITSKVEGASDINPSKPVVPDYPYTAKLYEKAPTVTTEDGETVEVPDGKGGTIKVATKKVTSAKPKTQRFGDSSVANSYGSTGWAWSFELDNIKQDTTVKAAAVRMTDYDTRFYDLYQEAAASVGVSQQKPEQLVRYPAKAGTYGAEPATVSGPGEDNDIDASATVSSTYDIVESGADTFDELAAPTLHPGIDEKADPDDDAVLVNPQDMVFITAPQSKGEIWYTTDGSEPEIGGENSTRYYLNAGNHITVSDLVEPGRTLTVRATSFLDGEASTTTSVDYRLATEAERTSVPVFDPVISAPAGKYQSIGYKHINLYSPTFGAEVYFTADGVDPTDVVQVKGDNLGYGSRDFTVWQDPQTGKAYLITAQDHIYIRVWELTDDFTAVDPTKEYDIYVGKHREAPAPIRVGEFVYLFTSYQSGWNPNQGQYARTSDIASGFDQPRNSAGIATNADFVDRENFDGPQDNGAYPKTTPDSAQPSLGHRNGEAVWSALQPFGDNTNYRSQPTRIFQIGTAENPQYLFFGDRWNPSALGKSTYTIYPLTIDNEAEGPLGTPGKATLTPASSVQISRADDGTLSLVAPQSRNLAQDQGVVVTSSTPAISGGTGEPYDPSVVIDGEDWDVDNYDDIEPFFRGVGSNYWITLELPKPAVVSDVRFSSRLIGGSEAAHYYRVYGSTDGTTWDLLVDAVDNRNYGYNSDAVSGVYKYIKLNITGNGKGDWASGVYEISVVGDDHAADTSALDAAIARGQQILVDDQGRYTFASLQALDAAVDDAVALRESGATTEATIASAVAAIDTAIDNLEPLGGAAVDKSDLSALYLDVEGLKKADYEPSGWKPFDAARKQAKAVLVDAKATQQQVDAAFQALQAALAGLTPVDPAPGPGEVALDVNARSQCVNGKAAIAVWAKNRAGVPADIRLSIPDATAKFTKVADGDAVYKLFELS